MLSTGEPAFTKITGPKGPYTHLSTQWNHNQHMTDNNLCSILSKTHFMLSGHATILFFWFEILNIFITSKIDSNSLQCWLAEWKCRWSFSSPFHKATSYTHTHTNYFIKGYTSIENLTRTFNLGSITIVSYKEAAFRNLSYLFTLQLGPGRKTFIKEILLSSETSQ